MTTVIGGSAPSITFSDSTTQSTAFTGLNQSASPYTTSLGYQAANSTTGTYNVAIGYQALYTNSTGANNTAIGYQAGYSNTTGQPLIAIGYQPLYANTTGVQNVAVGNIALTQNTTGGYNTAIGHQSLYANTTASFNTAMGYLAGYSNSTGGTITAVGANSLYNSTSDNNAAFGSNAGYGVTSGARNTFLGTNAGKYAGTQLPTTGNGNTYVGYGAVGSSGSVSGEIVVCAPSSDSSTSGKGSNTGFISPNGGGVYQGNNSSTWSTTSDARIKENVITLADGLTPILALRPVSFDYIVSKRADVSFIAQEYQTVLPDQVNTHAASPEEKAVAGTDTLFGLNKNLDPYLVRAVQQLNALIQAQATEIATLKAKVGI